MQTIFQEGEPSTFINYRTKQDESEIFRFYFSINNFSYIAKLATLHSSNSSETIIFSSG